MFDALKTVVAILSEKDPPREMIVLSLDDLCPLWIKYNTSFKPAEERSRKTKETVAPEETVPATAASEQEVALPSPPPTGRAHVYAIDITGVKRHEADAVQLNSFT